MNFTGGKKRRNNYTNLKILIILKLEVGRVKERRACLLGKDELREMGVRWGVRKVYKERNVLTAQSKAWGHSALEWMDYVTPSAFSHATASFI